MQMAQSASRRCTARHGANADAFPEMRARLVKALLRFFALLPLPANHALGAFIGWLAWVLPTPAKRITRINLDLCLPELSPAERRRLARRSLMEAGKTLTETGPLWYWSPGRIRRLVVRTQGTEEVDQAVDAGSGVIVVTPHLGSWEMAGHFAAMRWGITALYRPPRLRALEQVMRTGRATLGARLARTDAAGIRTLYTELRAGHMIGILPDQDPGERGGVFAPFFGVEANSMVLLPRLAYRSGAPVFFTVCERLPRGRGYLLRFTRAPDGITDPDPRIAATAMNQGVEACVRALPEQYQWNYRRFRTRPSGEPSLY